MADNLRLRGHKVHAIRARSIVRAGSLQATHDGRPRRAPGAASATVMAEPAEL
jgi:hypothetical protein